MVLDIQYIILILCLIEGTLLLFTFRNYLKILGLWKCKKGKKSIIDYNNNAKNIIQLRETDLENQQEIPVKQEKQQQGQSKIETAMDVSQQNSQIHSAKAPILKGKPVFKQVQSFKTSNTPENKKNQQKSIYSKLQKDNNIE